MLFTIAHAASPGAAEAASFVAKFNEIILFPVITLIMAIALLVFLYGSAIYIASANNPAGREEGQKHIMYGIIGMLIMLIAYSLLSVAANTFGLGDRLECSDNPSVPGCEEIFKVPRYTPTPITPNPNPNPSPVNPAPNPTPFPVSPAPNPTPTPNPSRAI